MAQKLSNLQFKTLQAEWYLKIKDKGFEDIEDTNSPKEFLKTWHSTYFKVSKRQSDYLTKEEYYYQAEQFLSEYQGLPLFFREQIHEEAWHLHSQGYSLRKIADHIKAKGIRTNKDEINKLIVLLRKLMNLG